MSEYFSTWMKVCDTTNAIFDEFPIGKEETKRTAILSLHDTLCRAEESCDDLPDSALWIADCRKHMHRVLNASWSLRPADRDLSHSERAEAYFMGRLFTVAEVPNDTSSQDVETLNKINAYMQMHVARTSSNAPVQERAAALAEQGRMIFSPEILVGGQLWSKKSVQETIAYIQSQPKHPAQRLLDALEALDF